MKARWANQHIYWTRRSASVYMSDVPGTAPVTSIVDMAARGCVMELHFPMRMTIRCFKCGKVYDVAFTSKERHEFPCPACGEVEVYDLGAMREKAAAAYAKLIRKSSGGR